MKRTDPYELLFQLVAASTMANVELLREKEALAGEAAAKRAEAAPSDSTFPEEASPSLVEKLIPVFLRRLREEVNPGEGS